MNEDAIVEKSESYLTESDIASSSGYYKPNKSWREHRASLKIYSSSKKQSLLDVNRDEN